MCIPPLISPFQVRKLLNTPLPRTIRQSAGERAGSDSMSAWHLHNARMGLARRSCEGEGVGKDAARAANQARSRGRGGVRVQGLGGGVLIPASRPRAAGERAGARCVRGLCPAPLRRRGKRCRASEACMEACMVQSKEWSCFAVKICIAELHREREADGP